MRYVITESKLESAIITYLDETFPIEDINWFHPYEYDDETGEEGEDENRIGFYIGDYNGEYDDTCFRWYDCEYFNKGSHARIICPTVELEHPYDRQLNGYFGDTWKEPFKKWFIKRYDLPVKTIDS